MLSQFHSTYQEEHEYVYNQMIDNNTHHHVALTYLSKTRTIHIQINLQELTYDDAHSQSNVQGHSKQTNLLYY